MSGEIQVGTYEKQTKRSVIRILGGITGAIILTGLVSNAATQYLAKEFHYTLALGEPYKWINNAPYYEFYKIWNWLYTLITAGIFNKSVLISTLMLLAGIAGGAFIIYCGFRRPVKKYWIFFQ